MTPVPGTRLGHYEILSAIGAGGMGEVYRARDTQLNRSVAIKILPELFAVDPERLARFTREAQTLAALNHPNIAQIYGLEHNGGSARALVMELVEGDDLSVLIERAPLALDEALRIARQIADALETAHEAGIVHRDLKPANVKVRHDGAVKVLDFGLAKAITDAGRRLRSGEGAQRYGEVAQGFSPALSPTLTQATAMGVILGTAAYMAPEQAKGKAVDKRADIWAFGIVLYEMLSGRRAFPGEGVSDTLAKVLEREPDWTALPPQTPPYVRALMERCLRKDPSRRLRDIGDARLELDEGRELRAPATAAPQRRGGLLVTAILAAAVGGGALGWIARSSPAAINPNAGVVQLDLLLPDGHELFTVAGSQISIAPDGSKVAFVAVGGGTRDLFVRALDAPAAGKARGTESAVSGFFGPDSVSLGLLARDRTLKRLSLGDGLITDIGGTVGTNAPVWGADGNLVFARQGLWRQPVIGGETARLTTLDAARGEVAHTPSAVLPTGIVLFTSWASDQSRVEAVDPASGVRKPIVDAASMPLYSPTGHLLFHRDGAVLAAPFDLRELKITGDAAVVFAAGKIRMAGGSPMLALAGNGTLVYAPALTGLTNLVRVTRSGVVSRLAESARPSSHPRVSPDGKRVVLEHAADSLWLQDLSRDARTPLTAGSLPGVGFPIWTRDGRSVVFRLFDELWRVDAGGSGKSERIQGGQPGDIPTALSPDGETLILLRTQAGSGGDVYALSMSGKGPARPLVQTPGYDGGGDFSPDGRFLAYASTDSGSAQIYLAPYPAMDRKWSVSTRGGTQARWSRSGREIFYRDGNRMMSVDVDASGQDVQLSTPKLLFEQPFTTGAYVTTANYDVLPDGDFVMLQAEPGVPRLTVILNWVDELRRRFK